MHFHDSAKEFHFQQQHFHPITRGTASVPFPVSCQFILFLAENGSSPCITSKYRKQIVQKPNLYLKRMLKNKQQKTPHTICSDRNLSFNREIALLETKTIFMLQSNLGSVVSASKASFQANQSSSKRALTPSHDNFKYHALVDFSSILTKFSFVLEERICFCELHSYTCLAHNQQIKYTHITCESSSCLDFHPNM